MFIHRLVHAATNVKRLFSNNKSTIEKGLNKVGKTGASVVGKGSVSGFKTIAKGAEKFTGKIADMAEKGTFQRMSYNAGKFTGNVARDFEYTARGANKLAGKLTGGIKRNGKVYGALLKDDPESLFFGKRATKLGSALIIGSAGIMGVTDATKNRLREQQGVMTGVAGNAPVNGYAYQGASYADNAGATGDIVLNMHNNRHGRIM